MSAEFHLSIITPDGAIFEEPVLGVSVPGQDGAFGVLNRHAPIVAQLTEGVVRVRQEGAERFFAIGTGILEVDHRTNCLLLVDSAASADNSEDAKALLR